MMHNTQGFFDNTISESSYIYIPFTKGEISEKFLRDINEFKESIWRHTGKNLMILFHSECYLLTLAPEAKIYVLGHGIHLSIDKKWNSIIADAHLPYDLLKYLPFSDWPYSVATDKKAISIDTIADRMISDGLLGRQNIHIKLWFCDLNNKAYILAKKFLDHFKNYPNVFRIDYYPNKIIYSLSEENGEMHKWARGVNDEIFVRASSIRKSLFSKNHPDNTAKSTPIRIK